jgi:hypothetical protein
MAPIRTIRRLLQRSTWIGAGGIAGMLAVIACGPPPLPPESARGFDREATLKVLRGIDVGPCEPPLGLKGSSHITVVFEPNGTVSSTAMDADDTHMEPRLILGGTATGACVERLFREVKIAPFQPGPPIVIGQVVTFGLSQKKDEAR